MTEQSANLSDAIVDPVELTAALVRCPSVTPDEGGALTILAQTLEYFGFTTRRVDREGVPNLYARIGMQGPVFGFNGHTDVVPIGDEAAWSHAPFGGEISEGKLWGRGSVDMKSGVAAFVAAACGLISDGEGPAAGKGSLALLITGDEEGAALHGTRALLDWMDEAGERLDVCLVGEPTSKERFGDVMKIGRRGSLTAYVTARGKGGHVAYPHKAANPLPPLLRMLDRLASAELDQGTAHFQPSTLQVTTVDVGNSANNVIPSEARAVLNIRFNDAQDSEALIAWIEKEAADAAESAPGVAIDVATRVSGQAFLTAPGPLTELVAASVEDVTGARPALDTGGGTSDARFVQAHCPVVEFGLVGDTMHQVDERASVEEITRLSEVYRRVLQRYFA